MKNFLRALAIMFALCFSVFSQENDASNCPTLSVKGPPGIIHPGEPFVFTAILDEKAENYSVEYSWLVSNGEILEGQGSSNIKVFFDKFNETITATVEIKGLPIGCENTASETAGVIICFTTVLIDEFSLSEQRIDKARLDNFFVELQNNPNDQGYIIEKFKTNTSKAVIKQKIAKINSYIKMRRFDPTRIVIIHDLAEESRTYFWRVPPGATPPIE